MTRVGVGLSNELLSELKAQTESISGISGPVGYLRWRMQEENRMRKVPDKT
jgi:hypothetical protein